MAVPLTQLWLGRDLVQKKQLNLEQAKEARKLLNMPGGLELHIGVSCSFLPQPTPAPRQQGRTANSRHL